VVAEDGDGGCCVGGAASGDLEEAATVWGFSAEELNLSELSSLAALKLRRQVSCMDDDGTLRRGEALLFSEVADATSCNHSCTVFFWTILRSMMFQFQFRARLNEKDVKFKVGPRRTAYIASNI
jgi:hypothetical protein